MHDHNRSKKSFCAVDRDSETQPSRGCKFNSLTAGPEYIRFFIFYLHINNQFFNMLKIKSTTVQNS